eukprot:TRINITY_DN2717_c0_g1_i1.p1 TRINITY_DN2717_c0_g1~~TRINITY_DN2717_c0_g1_i1.p1  ORF type:complete len:1751 (+),score=711.14 TRINITY_DN2717_c0_g1_i1:58-5310(+)
MSAPPRRAAPAAAAAGGGGSAGRVKVYVRTRPFSEREIAAAQQRGEGLRSVVEFEGPTCKLLDTSGPEWEPRVRFTFDGCFWSVGPAGDGAVAPPFARQADVYRVCGTEMVTNVLDGYNACLFAYGQTGSGKTYTMLGDRAEQDMEGVIPRLCRDLFGTLHGRQQDTKIKVLASYMEIYNEAVRDLLSTKHGEALKVRQDPVSGPFVEDLSVHEVTDVHAVLRLMDKGTQERTWAATKANDRSSRSHAIFSLVVSQLSLDPTAKDTGKLSKLNLVDLAGSERVSVSGAEGIHLREATKINLSLYTLGRVIDALADQSSSVQKAHQHMPYRDSTLTWILSDSLGGNSRTAMIATVSPSVVNLEETTNTLRYASRARDIINIAVVNVSGEVARIKELEAKVDFLQKKLGSQSGGQAYLLRIAELEKDLRMQQEAHQRTETARMSLCVEKRERSVLQSQARSQQDLKMQKLEMKLKKQRHEADIAVQDAEKMRQENGELRSRCDQLSKKLKEAKDKLADHRGEKQRMQQDLSTFKAAAEDSRQKEEAAVRRLESLSSETRVLDRQVRGADELNARLMKDKNEASQLAADAAQRVSELTKEVEMLRQKDGDKAKAAELAALRKRAEQAEAAKSSALASVRTLEADVEELKGQVRSAVRQAEQDRAAADADKQSYQKAQKQRSGQIDALQKQLAEVTLSSSETEQQIQEVQEERSHLQARVKALTDDRDKARAGLSEREEQLRDLQEQLEAETAQLRERETELTRCRDTVTDTQRHLAEETLRLRQEADARIDDYTKSTAKEMAELQKRAEAEREQLAAERDRISERSTEAEREVARLQALHAQAQERERTLQQEATQRDRRHSDELAKVQAEADGERAERARLHAQREEERMAELQRSSEAAADQRMSLQRELDAQRDLKKGLERHSSDLEGQKKGLEEQLSRALAHAELLTRQVQQGSRDLEQRKEELMSARSALDSMREEVKQRDRQLTDVRAQVSAAEQRAAADRADAQRRAEGTDAEHAEQMRRLEDERRHAATEVSRARDRTEAARGSIERLQKELEAEKRAADAEKAQRERLADSLQRKEEEHNTIREQVLALEVGLESQRTRFNRAEQSWQQEVHAYQVRLEEADQQLSRRTDELSRLRQELDQARDEQERWQGEAAEQKGQAAKASGECKSERERAASLSEMLEQLRASTDGDHARLMQQLEAAERATREERARTDAAQGRLEGVSANADVLRAELRETSRRQAELEVQLAGADARNAAAESALADVRAKLEAAQGEHKQRAAEAEAALADVRANLGDHQQRAAEAEAKHADTTRALEASQAEAGQHAQRAAQLEEHHSATLAQLGEERGRLEQSRRELSAAQTELGRREEAAAEQQREHASARALLEQELSHQRERAASAEDGAAKRQSQAEAQELSFRGSLAAADERAGGLERDLAAQRDLVRDGVRRLELAAAAAHASSCAALGGAEEAGRRELLHAESAQSALLSLQRRHGAVQLQHADVSARHRAAEVCGLVEREQGARLYLSASEASARQVGEERLRGELEAERAKDTVTEFLAECQDSEMADVKREYEDKLQQMADSLRDAKLDEQLSAPLHEAEMAGLGQENRRLQGRTDELMHNMGQMQATLRQLQSKLEISEKQLAQYKLRDKEKGAAAQAAAVVGGGLRGIGSFLFRSGATNEQQAADSTDGDSEGADDPGRFDHSGRLEGYYAGAMPHSFSSQRGQPYVPPPAGAALFEPGALP